MIAHPSHKVSKCTTTRERWISLCQRLGAKDDPVTERTINSIYAEIITAYTESSRHYHDINHIRDGLVFVDEVHHLVEDPDILEAAWWLHDFVYNTRSGPKENEEDSAVFADKIFRKLEILPHKRIRIMRRILSTTHDHIPIHSDDWFMIDIDLASLASPPETFDENAEKIRKEHGASVEAFKIGRANFFRKFLADRPSIYLSAYFQNKYEALAQENIKRFLSTVRSE